MSEPRPFAKIIIEGKTTDGATFRPSDWAERLSGNLSTFRNRRIYYSPRLRPAIRDGVKCVIVDEELGVEHPALFEDILAFARTNKLKMYKKPSS